MAIGKPKSKVIPNPYSLYLRGVDPEWIQVDPSGSDCSLLTAIVGRYDVFGDRTFILGGHTQSRVDLSGSDRPRSSIAKDIVAAYNRSQHSRSAQIHSEPVGPTQIHSGTAYDHPE